MKEKKDVWFLDLLIQIHRELLNGGSKRNGKKRAGNKVRNMRKKVEGRDAETDSLQSASFGGGLLCNKAGSSVR